MKYNGLKWILLLLAAIVCGVTGCSKDDGQEETGGGGIEEPAFETSAYNLNVVYFVPSDQIPFGNYQSRISDVLLWIQDFYRKEMIRNGFGNRSFGLNMTAEKLVNIIQIPGAYTKDKYPYEGGGAKAQKEIDEYFKQHPEEKTSEHVLVIMPSTSKNNMDPGGTPFYGLGKYCFAMDYRYFELKYLGLPTDEGVLFTKWLGGMAHEMGHGLNLPHNRERVSDEKTLGTALMGTGNMTLGLHPTFITQASCAILHTCQVFSPVKRDDFYVGSYCGWRTLKISFDKEYIRVNASYNLRDKNLMGANIYFDNLPAGPPAGEYDAESWYVKTIGQDSIYLDIPWSELHRPRKDFAIRILLLYEDGSSQSGMYEFIYEDGKLEDIDYSVYP